MVVNEEKILAEARAKLRDHIKSGPIHGKSALLILNHLVRARLDSYDQDFDDEDRQAALEKIKARGFSDVI